MREILFKGKRKDNGEWVEGSLSTEYLKECGCVMISPTADTCYKVDPETVGQYTGLTDKNGKRIFEGDIVKACLKPICFFQKCYAMGKIVFENGTFKISVYKASNEAKYKEYTEENVISYSVEKNFIDRGYELEVIGNIHDNPELLKGGAE